MGGGRWHRPPPIRRLDRDLSQNDLSRSIPDFLEWLSSLVYLDLSGNKLNWSVPAGLLKRSEEGSLTLRTGDSCTNSSSCEPRKKKDKIAIIVAFVLIVVILVVLDISLIIFLCKKKREKAKGNGSNLGGKGGFGSVYVGQLDNGTPVAVKIRNQLSSQGIKEFIAEVEIVMRMTDPLPGYRASEFHLSLHKVWSICISYASHH